MGAVRDFLDKHYRHFNARETVWAARAYEEHLAAGGKMLVSLAGAMSTARSEAITRGTQAGVCASANGTSCSGSNDDWGKFILVFVDSDLGSDFDNTEPLLKSFAAHNQVSQTASVAAIYFRPSGFSTLNTASNIDVCHIDLDESSMCRRVNVGPSGNVSVTTITVSS